MAGFIVVNIDPILAQIGPLAFRWYGLMYVVGIAVGIRVAYPYARQRGMSDDDVWAVVWPSVVAGFIGARLYFVVQQPLGPYLSQPWRIMATWEGGMAFFGAIFAVVATILVVTRLRRISFWSVADVAVLFAVVGQAFGRMGNMINGDIVGPPTDLPWGFIYAHPRSFVADHTVAYQPAALYELMFNAAFFGLLWFLRHRLPRPGLLFAVYLAGYSIGQFGLFFLRTEPIVAFGLQQAQVTSLVVMAGAAVLAWWLATHPEKQMAAADRGPATRPGPIVGARRVPPKRKKRQAK